jgi:hypothetical protein
VSRPWGLGKAGGGEGAGCVVFTVGGLAVSSDVPVQYFQSIIAVELAIAGALLFQVRFFDKDRADQGDG